MKQPMNRINPPTTVRTSVSLPSSLHTELERIARTKKVSLAWVIREAAEKYVADKWPLLTQDQ
jgi:metal-responsive CopG/Arc/MetJ family transcriptional regulator